MLAQRSANWVVGICDTSEPSLVPEGNLKSHFYLTAPQYVNLMITLKIKLVSKELDSVPKYHVLEATLPRSSFGRALG